MNTSRRTEKSEGRRGLFEKSVDSIPDGILAVDCEGKAIVWNGALKKMTGVRKEEVLGRGEYAYAVPFYGERRPMLANILFGDGKEWERKHEEIKQKDQIVVGIVVPVMLCTF